MATTLMMAAVVLGLVLAGAIERSCNYPRGIAQQLHTQPCSDRACTQKLSPPSFWDQPSGLALDNHTQTLFVAVQQGFYRLVAVDLKTAAPARAWPVCSGENTTVYLAAPYAVAFVADPAPTLFVVNYQVRYNRDDSPVTRVKFSRSSLTNGDYSNGEVTPVVVSEDDKNDFMFAQSIAIDGNAQTGNIFVACGNTRQPRFVLAKINLASGHVTWVDIVSDLGAAISLDLTGIAIAPAASNEAQGLTQNDIALIVANFNSTNKPLLRVIVKRNANGQKADVAALGTDLSNSASAISVAVCAGADLWPSATSGGSKFGRSTFSILVLWSFQTANTGGGAVTRLYPVNGLQANSHDFTCPSTTGSTAGINDAVSIVSHNKTVFVITIDGRILRLDATCECPGNQGTSISIYITIITSAMLVLGVAAAMWRQVRHRGARGATKQHQRVPAGLAPLLHDSRGGTSESDELQTARDAGLVGDSGDRPSQGWLIARSELSICTDDLLGSGATARVFRGTFHGAAVAVKELPVVSLALQSQVSASPVDDHPPAEARRLSRLRSECQLLSSLHHPNIVKFFGVAMPSASFVYVVTELCLSDLDRAMCSSLSAAGCTAPTMWHSFARQIASAVSYLHARNIIHRDLKPANVLITNSGTSGCTAKICDFGISKQASGDSGPFAATHTGMLGTPAYMAPEVFMGRSLKASYSKAVDVYSFGILLWAMWTGNLPYDDVPGSVYAMLKAIEDGRRPARVFNALRELSDDQGVAGQANCSSARTCSTDVSEQLPPQQPQHVPEDVWLLVSECWHCDPELRPNMDTISQQLTMEKWALLGGKSDC